MNRYPALIALAFATTLGLSACGEAEEQDDVEVEENGEVGED